MFLAHESSSRRHRRVSTHSPTRQSCSRRSANRDRNRRATHHWTDYHSRRACHLALSRRAAPGRPECTTGSNCFRPFRYCSTRRWTWCCTTDCTWLASWLDWTYAWRWRSWRVCRWFPRCATVRRPPSVPWSWSPWWSYVSHLYRLKLIVLTYHSWLSSWWRTSWRPSRWLWRRSRFRWTFRLQ